jgi:molybdopterin-biosynthesis enzyme MoeA-like protein
VRAQPSVEGVGLVLAVDELAVLATPGVPKSFARLPNAKTKTS